MIQFATPWILWGALTAALPILIHLFGKRKTKQVAFSSLRFLKSLQHEQIRTLKIKQILVLILRTLLLLFLVLAFAGPRYAPSSAQGVAHEVAVMVLDNSISSSFEQDGQPYLARLKSLATDVANQRGSSETIVWSAMRQPDTRYVTAGQSVPQQFLNDLEPQYGKTDLVQYFSDLRRWLDEQNYGSVDVFLFTDGQSEQFKVLQELNLEPWNSSRWFIVTPQQRNRQVGIASVDLPTEMLQPGVELPLEVQVARNDSTTPATTAIQVVRNGEKTGQSLIDWQDALQTTEQFQVPGEQSGFFRVEAAIGNDEYEADNHWYLNGYIPERVNVLLVSDSPESGFFLETVLQSLNEETTQFAFQSIALSQLADELSGNIDLVVLTNTVLSVSDRQSLEQARRQGTGIMIFPGDKMRGNANNPLLAGLPLLGDVVELPGEAYQSVSRVNWQHPVFRNLTYRDHATIQLPKASRFFRIGRGNYSRVMELSSGNPLVIESAGEGGKAWLWTVAPTLNWTDLPRRGMFVPLMMRSVYYLSNTEQNYRSQLTTGDAIQFTIQDTDISNRLTLITPTGKSVVIPVQGGTAQYTESLVPGHYSLNDGEKLLALFSVNIESQERSMATLNSEQWQVIFGDNYGGYFTPGQNTLHLQEAGLVRGTPLWQWLIALALLCVIGEMLLTRMDKTTKETN